MSEEEKIKTLNNRKSRLRASMTRILNYSSNLKSDSNPGEVRVKITQLEDVYRSFLLLLDEYDTVDVGNKDDLEKFIEIFENDYTNIKTKMDGILENLKTNNSPTTSGNNFSPNSNVSCQVLGNKYKLPDLKLPTFDGNLLKYQEFWDSFKSKIHDNIYLNDTERFEYLDQCLSGKAKDALTGISVNENNYSVAISILQKKFSDKNLVINSYYSKFRNIYNANETPYSLRKTFDELEKIIKCLNVLGEDMEHNSIQSIILSKFPQSITVKIFEKVESEKLTTKKLRDTLENIITSYEKSNILKGTFRNDYVSSKIQTKPYTKNVTTSALTNSEDKKCIYCTENHFNDECKKFPTTSQRKAKIKGKCFLCLKEGHSIKNCKSDKFCIYCKTRKNHHRSLCPKKFGNDSKKETVLLEGEEEKEERLKDTVSMLSMNEEVIMQTFYTNLVNAVTRKEEKMKGLLDSGSQRSYVTSNLVKKLELQSQDSDFLSILSFGNTKGKMIESPKVQLKIKLLNDEFLDITANVVPNITGRIKTNSFDRSILTRSYQNLQFADSSDDEVIELLIGNDYYYDLISTEKITVMPGLYLINSKLGWIVSGRYSCGKFDTISLINVEKEKHEIEPMFNDFQLIGDSQFVRFADQILGYKTKKLNYDGRSMFGLGLCISGQTIKQLLQKIENKKYPLSEKVICLIGANDLLKGYDIEHSIENFDRLVNTLVKNNVKKLIILTLPPIPKFETRADHWKNLEKINSFIRSKENHIDVFILEVDELFMNFEKKFLSERPISNYNLSPVFNVRSEFFEPCYGNNRARVDLIHLNKKGFLKIKELIENKIKYLNDEFKPDDITMSFLTILQPNNLNLDFFENDTILLPDSYLKNFWDLENIGIKENPVETGDDFALKKFNETIRFENSRYSVTWPWITYPPELSDNYGLSLGRLNSLLKQHGKNREFLSKYNDIISDQLSLGIIEKVEKEQCDSSVIHYLPHHAVIRPDKNTTKVRIVYDGSAKTKKYLKSINECLYRGPVILEDLCGLLLNFRLSEVCVVSDIEKAFLQIELQLQERDAVRFLWIKDLSLPHTENNLQEYRFKRVPFGIVCSPFLLAAVIKYHLSKAEEKWRIILERGFYVDNLIIGLPNSEEALDFYNYVKNFFFDMSMNLREWKSNDTVFNKSLPKEDLLVDDIVNVLGLKWDTNKDILKLKRKTNVEFEGSVTKRNILKKVQSIFDPLGFVSPCMLMAKILIQNLWDENLDWDDEIPEKYKIQWLEIAKELISISDLKFPRLISHSDAIYELHCFTDASKNAFATAVYLKSFSEVKVQSHLIFSKSHLRPIKKKITIPRLELLGVLIGVRNIDFIIKSLKIEINSIFLWTDSQVVLYWLKTEKILPVFVERRVKEIKSHKSITFRYVSSENNPADIATKGKKVDELKNDSKWWHGPDWIILPKENWPNWCNDPKEISDLEKTETNLTREEISDLEKTGKNVTRESNFVCLVPEITPAPLEIDISRFSSYMKFCRVLAYCLRFVKNCKGPDKTTGFISFLEINNAKIIYELYVQSFCEINDKNKYLNLFKDNCGLLRCRGRFSNSINLNNDQKFPKFLPADHPYTHLLITYIHKKHFHVGVTQVLSILRKNYWIERGRIEIKKVLKKCPDCIRLDVGPYRPPDFPPLPLERTSICVPFTYTGVDFFGPLYVKCCDDNLQVKVYGVIFTCLTVRALHLDLLSNLTSSEFLLAFKRFISTRGLPKKLISDNAAAFKVTDKLLRGLSTRFSQSEDINNYFTECEITWKFIPELSPWMGGVYERLILSIKNCLKRSLYKLVLYRSQLLTVLKEIEFTLNSRPLTYVDSNNCDFTADILSPFCFLNFRTKNNILENFDCNSRQSLSMLWKSGKNIVDSFWKIWLFNYLTNLREKERNQFKLTKNSPDRIPNLGDIVLIEDTKNCMNRNDWKLGKIVELVESNDGEVRSAKIRTRNGFIIRPIRKLYPLEI